MLPSSAERSFAGTLRIRCMLLLPTLFLFLASPARAELSLFVSATPHPARPGESLDVAISVSNSGLPTHQGVIVELIVPQGVIPFREELVWPTGNCPDLVPGAYYSCQPTETLTWQLGDLESGEAVTLRIPATVADPAPSTIEFAVDVSDSAGPVVPLGSNSDLVPVTTDAASAPLELRLADSADPVEPGDVIDYTLAFGNSSEFDAAGNAILVFTPPDGTTLVSATPPYETPPNDTIRWLLGTLAPGQEGIRRVTVAVDGAAEGGLLEAKATLNAGSFPEALVRKATRALSGSDLALALVATPDPAQAGGVLDIELLVANRGPADLGGIKAYLAVPEEWNPFREELVNASGDCPDLVAGSYYSCQAGETLVWDLGTLPAGQGRVLQLPPEVAATLRAGTVLELDAWAQRQGATNPQFAERSVAFLAQTDAALDLALSDGPDPAAPGGELTYTLAFGHRAPVLTAHDAMLRFVPPAGTTLSSHPGGRRVGNTVEWSIARRVESAAGGVRQVTVEVGDTVPDGTILEARAEVFDTAPASAARAGAATRVETDAPLALGIALPNGELEQGQGANVDYTITNDSPDTLLDVAIQALVPAGIQPFAESLADGGDCPDLIAGSYYYCQPGERITWPPQTLSVAQSRSSTVPYTIASTTGAPVDGDVLVFDARASNAAGEATAQAARAVPEGDVSWAGATALAALGWLRARVRRERGGHAPPPIPA